MRPSDAYMPEAAYMHGRRQAIIWTNARILLIRPLGTNVSEIFIGYQIFSFKKMHYNMSSAKRRLVYLGLNVLSYQQGTDDVFRDLVNAILAELRMLRMKLNNGIIYQ